MARVDVEESLMSRAQGQRAAGVPVDLPVEYNEYVANTLWIQRLGLWSWLKGRVLFRRAGAYELCDVVSFLFAYFSGPRKKESLGDFGGRSGVFGSELAGLLDRLRWITQGSLSRGLGSVDVQLAQQVSRELLLRSAAAASQSSVVANTGYRDGLGEAWEVFHWDVTVTTIRSRALPEDESLPYAHRIGPRLGAPGYPGRKRGELQISRSTVCEATSAVWLEADIQAGNGDLHAQLTRGATAISAYLGDAPMRKGRAVVVADGVSGGHPQAMELRQHGLSFVTRSNAYSVLQTPAGEQALQARRWRTVEDSQSGPKRQALELGDYTVRDGLVSRMVVSRFPATESGRGAGIVIGSWHYELFLTDLPATHWAAEDVVTLYYGRTAIENRFAAEDRDYSLDRILSCHLPGQMLACSVALAVWNLRLVNGLSLTEGATPERPQELRAAIVDDSPNPAAPQSHEAKEPEPIPDEPVTEACVETLPGDTLAQTMNAWCSTHPGWTPQPALPAFVCPAGHVLPLSAERTLQGEHLMRFRMRGSHCNACPLRAVCAPRAIGPRLRREISLCMNPGKLRPANENSTSAPMPQRRMLQSRLRVADIATPPPPRIPIAPALLPAVVRRLTTTLVEQAEIAVRVEPLDPAERKAVHLALTNAARQRRRMTIEQRVALNQRPNADVTRIRMRGPPEFAAWLRGQRHVADA